MKIVFLSHTTRSSIFRVGSYYLSKTFSDLGHEILYISSPLSLAHLLYHNFGKKVFEFSQRWELRSFKTDNDEVVNHVPLLLFPFIDSRVFGSYKFYKKFNYNFTTTFQGIKRLGFDKPDLVIQDSLKLNFCHQYFSQGKKIYRATDLYAEMPGAPSSMKEAEKETVNISDYILTTSEPLQKKIKKTYKVDVHLFRNGVNYEHFVIPRKKPKEYEFLSGPTCVYVGSMDERFNHSLIMKLAEQANLNIVLIGPLEKFSFSGYDNVHCLGKIHPDKLPPFLQHADVGLLPFKDLPANHSRSPMKIYEYGASGLPVVSTWLDEVERRDSKFVFLAKTDQQFIHLVNKAVRNKDKIKKKARSESKRFSWRKIANDFLSLITEEIKS